MILVKFQKTIQISPDDYQVVWCERLFKKYVSIAIILEWAEQEWAGSIYANKPLPSLSVTIPQTNV